MTDFATEQGPFPFVHVVVPAALYVCSRWLLFAAFLAYFFESLERIASHYFPALVETPDDSLIGDPIQGLLAIIIFFLIDQIFEFDVAVRYTIPVWRRAVAFILIGVTSPLATLLNGPSGNFGVLIYLAVYVAIALAVFAPHLWYANGALEQRAATSIWVWLALVCLYAVIATPATTSDVLSVWMRMFVTSALLLCIVVGLYIIKANREAR